MARRPPTSESPLRARRSLARDEAGAVAVYVAVSAAVLMGIVGLAIDGSRAMVTHSEAQAAADAAALAGASQLDAQANACSRAKAQAATVANQQKFAEGGPANVSLSSGSPPRCLSGLPDSDDDPLTGKVTTDDAASRFIEVTTQQLTHQNTLLQAVAPGSTAQIQRTAVAGFRRTLCAASPVMMACPSLVWTPGVAFDAWSSYGGNKGFISNCSNGGAPCVKQTLESVQPKFCVVDSSLAPKNGNKTNMAEDGLNSRFDYNNLSSSTAPSDLNTVDYTPYSSEVPGAPKAGATSWNCLQYWADKHGGTPPGGCTATSSMTRYQVYQRERDLHQIPQTGAPNVPEERRLIYLAIYPCAGAGVEVPTAYLKAFMLGPAQGPAGGKPSAAHTLWVEPIGLATSRTDPAVHEEVQLYR